MKIVYPNAKEFETVIRLLSNVVDEALFEFGSDGFRVRALDPSRVMFVSVELPKSSFEEYDVEETEVGVNLAFLGKIMKTAKKGDKIGFELDNDMLKITLIGKMRRSFKTGIVNTEYADVDVPELDFTATARVESKELFDAVKDVSLVSDAVQIKVEKGKVIVSGTGSTSNVTIEIECESEGEGKASYGVNYLIDILKPIRNGEIGIRLGDTMPLLVEYTVSGGKISVLLAPRVEEE